MNTTTQKNNSKVNTEKEQLLKRILENKKVNAPICSTMCVGN